jgi:hypothetical protein
LPDQHHPEAEKADSNNPAPTGLAERQVQPRSDGKPKPANAAEHRSQQDKPPTYKTLWREIRIIDVINCLVGAAMLIVAVAAYRVASDTSDIKTAISNLSELADQTKLQHRQKVLAKAAPMVWTPARPAGRMSDVNCSEGESSCRSFG